MPVSETKELLARIKAVPSLKPILARIWEKSHPEYRRFFFTHRELLFASFEEADWTATLPFFFAGKVAPEDERLLFAFADTRIAEREALVVTHAC